MSSGGGPPEAAVEQLELVRETARRTTKSVRKKEREPAPVAADRPVARVAVDVPFPHLDRPFDYLVPAELDADAVPGARVRVRFAGQLVDGFVLAREDRSEHTGSLARLPKVVSPEPVLAPEIADLARAVANRYAGTVADVLRLAVPPRHARVEAEPPPERIRPAGGLDPGPWEAYPDGETFLAALADGRPARAVWAALPGAPWAPAVAAAVAATLAGGRGALVVVPDARDLARLGAALDAALGPGGHLELTADLGPAERYRRWLAVRRGAARAVIGTRAAMFAPVADLGLVVVWDDGDDLHAEPRAPYPHVREVLCLRAHLAGAAALIGGYAVTAEGAALVETGWARSLAAPREIVRARGPRVAPAGTDTDLERDPAARAARLPSVAWQTARAALANGPVLLQVPRRGYLPILACVRCREVARCRACSGPLGLAAGERSATCRLCAQPAEEWACPACGATAFRSVVVGVARTAEEIGRAFPNVPVRHSSADGTVLAAVDDTPALILATPGAEPEAAHGYAAALLLDGDALLARADLRAAEEAVRRWANAAALVRPGGHVVLMADPAAPAVQALVRWDPFGFAERELTDRQALGFPPAVRLAVLTGPAAAISELLEAARLPAAASQLGPVPTGRDGTDDAARAVVRVPRASGSELAAALRAGAGVRSARKAAGSVRIQIDPAALG
ncbi:primosomal protein N' [Sporichthya polymorpha]|uniref:primosomal protein N' n=1 Tax=Sporichthya polymorpha TaxID=35751 RepID=UPI0003818983|nr:primosomal protein N' [Sporichthya polymorpha]